MENFELGKLLGNGAFGSVNKVIRKSDRKEYAMKRVKLSQLEKKEKENALNEVRILASLNHPNIIGYKEAFYDDNSKILHIVMELADDGDIETKIDDNKRNKLCFQENTIWNILIQILQGLKFLHDNKIIHRDLKSANIFLMKNGLVKIGDLNVSKLAKIGKANTHTGTPYYSSPEIWIDQPYNNKTDIWSVGCIIYEMCSLSPPFRGTSLINLYNNIQKGVYSPIPDNYSKELSYVISLMLVVDPNVRASCDKLLGLRIVQDKMKEIKGFNFNSDNNYKVELIQTIKLPKKSKDINRVLPQKKKYHVENEMMENDEFETKKAGFFKKVNKENNNINNNNNNHHHGGKHISNSHNKQINHNNISNHQVNKRPVSAIQRHLPQNKINNIHQNNNNQKNYNSNKSNNNNNRPSSGKKISNNIISNKPTNNAINSNNNNNNHNKIKIKPKVNDNNSNNNMRVRKRPVSARPSQKQGLNINKSNINQNKENNYFYIRRDFKNKNDNNYNLEIIDNSKKKYIKGKINLKKTKKYKNKNSIHTNNDNYDYVENKQIIKNEQIKKIKNLYYNNSNELSNYFLNLNEEDKINILTSFNDGNLENKNIYTKLINIIKEKNDNEEENAIIINNNSFEDNNEIINTKKEPNNII